MSRRTAVWAVAASAVALGLILGVVWLTLFPDDKHAQRYLGQMKVDQGYRRIGTGSEGNCGCNLIYYYVGPSPGDSVGLRGVVT